MRWSVLNVFRRRPLVFPLVLVGALAMLIISEGSYRRSVGMLDELGRMGSARSSMLALQQGILDAEAGQRAFAASGLAEDLRRHDLAVARVEASFALLDRYYAGQAQPQALLDRLHRQAAALLAAPLQTGSAAVDSIRALGNELFDQEAQRVAASREELYRSLLLGRVGVALLSAISLLSLFMYLRQSVALEAQAKAQQRLLLAGHQRLEAEVAERTAQLTELTHHLQTAREDERSRLARDLHDELGALLTSAKLDAARIRSRLAGHSPEALERLVHLVQTLDAVIALKRRITEDLRPSSLTPLGLVATLEILAREFAAQSGIDVHCELGPVDLAPAAQLVVYRLVQEALTNIAKYAGARQTWITLGTTAGGVEVSVRDDGAGFDPAAVRRGAHGLVGMRYRVEAEHGHMTLVSAPGRGTRIQVRLPAVAAVVTSVPSRP